MRVNYMFVYLHNGVISGCPNMSCTCLHMSVSCIPVHSSHVLHVTPFQWNYMFPVLIQQFLTIRPVHILGLQSVSQLVCEKVVNFRV